jgi:MFS superfamily sulfate permease-like transporter
MMIIVAVVVIWTLFVLGVLVGISVAREVTRRRTSRLDRDRVAIERDRADLEAEWRLVGTR